MADVSGANGIEFERETAGLLTELGWDARTTPATADYGADVVANLGEETLVAQCKDWSGPVGYDAIKEVHAARTHYGATLAIVVARNDFTRQAKNEAEKFDILLFTPAGLCPGCDVDRTRKGELIRAENRRQEDLRRKLHDEVARRQEEAMRRQEEERQEKIAVERQNRADWLGEIKRSITLAFCGGWFGCVVGSFVPAIWTSNPQASDTWLVIGAFIGSVCGWTRGPASYTKQKNRDLNTNKLLADFSKEHRQPSIMPAPKSASDSPQSKIDAVKPITTPLIFLHPQPNYNNNGDNVVATETQQEASSTFIASAKNIPRSGAAPSVPLIPTISEEDKAPVSAYVDTPIESDLGKGEKYASMRCPNCSGNLLLPSDGFGQVICPLCRRLFWADTRRGQSISWRSLSAGHSYEDQGETKHSLPAYPPIGPTQTANSGRLTGSDRPAGADQPHHATASRQPPAKFCSSIDGAERVVWTINDRSLGNRTIPSCEDQDEAKHSLGNLSATCPRCIQTKRVSGNLNQTRCANCGHRFNYL